MLWEINACVKEGLERNVTQSSVKFKGKLHAKEKVTFPNEAVKIDANVVILYSIKEKFVDDSKEILPRNH